MAAPVDAGPPMAMRSSGGSEAIDGLPTRAARSRTARGPMALTLVADTFALAFAAALVGRPTSSVEITATLVAVILVGLAALAGRHLYHAHIAATWSLESSRLLQATALLIVAAALLQPWPSTEHADGLLQIWVLTSALLLVGRAGVRSVLRRQRRRGARSVPVLLAGDGRQASRFATLLQDHPDAGFRVVGAVGPRDSWTGTDIDWHGEDPIHAAAATGATGAIIETAGTDPATVLAWVTQLQAADLHVLVATGLRGLDHHRVVHRPLAHEPLVYVEAPRLRRTQRVAKRTLDLVLAPIALAAVAPVLLVAALAIKRDGAGPVFFRQHRVGRDGTTFRIFKLRTMHLDAEERRAELDDANLRTGPLFKMSNDPRVTRAGRWLRATSIDELPQLLNVIQGDMSLVGPRPALPSEVAAFDEELRRRSELKPGITGLWQIEARDCPSFDAYRRLDLFYVANWSIALDLMILTRTAPVVAAKGLNALLRRSRTDASAPAFE